MTLNSSLHFIFHVLFCLVLHYSIRGNVPLNPNPYVGLKAPHEHHRRRAEPPSNQAYHGRLFDVAVFQNKGVPFGVQIVRIVAFWGLCWGPPILETTMLFLRASPALKPCPGLDPGMSLGQEVVQLQITHSRHHNLKLCGTRRILRSRNHNLSQNLSKWIQQCLATRWPVARLNALRHAGI